MKPSRYTLLVVTTVIISPLFGVILAESLGYREPLDVAAEALGLKDLSDEIRWTPFVDYSVPGLPEPIGYIVSGLLGVVVILLIGRILRAIV